VGPVTFIDVPVCRARFVDTVIVILPPFDGAKVAVRVLLNSVGNVVTTELVKAGMLGPYVKLLMKE
jgi:hypothetical protein